MELAIVPVDSSFKDNQTLYEEWFNFADAGSSFNNFSIFATFFMIIQIH